MTDKIYSYQSNGVWRGSFNLEEILSLNLPDITLIWWEGLCPNGYPPKLCDHCIRLGKLKKNHSEMSNELQSTNQQKQTPQRIKEFEDGLIQFLEEHNLPSTGILVPVLERLKVFSNIESIFELIPDKEKANSIYLSKFTAGVASGLFDAALNYLWDETIIQIRKRVVQYDLEYFYDNAVQSSEKRKKLNDDADLVKLDDYELIKGAKEIGLISELGFKHLEFINYMRNWASAAHPNQNELTGLQLVSWLETCVKEVITLPISNVAVRIKELLGSIKKTTISDNEAAEIGSFFDNLTQEQINNLVSGFFGIYVNTHTESQTRQNIVKLLPYIWDSVSEDIKDQFGMKYANFVANNYQNEKNLSRNFLKIVESENYIPEDLRVVEIEQTLNGLLVSHRSSNNFYSEPTFIRQLKSMIGIPPKVPKSIERKFILGMVEVFLTNGYGVAINAEPVYREMLTNLDERGSLIAAFSFVNDEIASKLQFQRCADKFREMLGILKNNIPSSQLRGLIERIEQTHGPLDNLKFDTQIKQKMKDLRALR